MRTLVETASFPPIVSINVFPHINISFMVNQWCLPPIFWCFIPPITGKVWDGRSYCLTNIINLVDHCCNECTKIHWSASLVQFRSTRCNLVLGLAKVPMSKFVGFKQGLWHEIKIYCWSWHHALRYAGDIPICLALNSRITKTHQIKKNHDSNDDYIIGGPPNHPFCMVFLHPFSHPFWALVGGNPP